MTTEESRELTLTLRFTTFGSKKQARRTAERVREMLSVELHQEVQLVKQRQKVLGPCDTSAPTTDG